MEKYERGWLWTLTSVKMSKKPTAAKIVPRCIILNARSIVRPNAVPALHAELIAKNIDICFISETWLNKSINSQVSCLDGYLVVRKDRTGSRKGGEVAVLCRNDFKINALNFTETPYLEIVWCKNINIKYRVFCRQCLSSYRSYLWHMWLSRLHVQLLWSNFAWET